MKKPRYTSAHVYVKEQSTSAAAVVRIGNKTYDVFRMSSSSQHTATFRAALTALISLPDEMVVTVHSDLEYLVETMNEWVYQWRQNGWRKNDGTRPANLDVIQALLYHAERLRAVSWRFERVGESTDLWITKHKAAAHRAAYAAAHPIRSPNKPLRDWTKSDWTEYFGRIKAYWHEIEADDAALAGAQPPAVRARRARRRN